MEAWIPITIAAAFAQNLRFMLQKQLRATALSTAGATFARFVYSAPLIALLVALYLRLSGQVPEVPGGRFFAFAFTGGLSQILATVCVVALFAERNFAVGISLKKTEALQTAIIGFVVLGEALGPRGWVAIGIGVLGLLALSDPPGGSAQGWRRVVNRASALGLGSGILFAISATCYRGATLELGFEAVLARSGFTLAVVTSFQTLVMIGWFLARDRAQMGHVLRAWRLGALMGLSSMAGSICWFTAFALQHAALVKALGQIELLFSYAATVFVFHERVRGREVFGTGLLLVSILLLVFWH